MAVIAQTGLPMVPAVIVGSHEAFPRGGRTIRRGRRMKLIIGEPVDPTAFAAVEELIAHVHERMKRTYDARRAEIVDGSSRAERMLAPVTAEPADQRG
jgi:1-acyl-sn-glycerol-3-phosphate acyltransferase